MPPLADQRGILVHLRPWVAILCTQYLITESLDMNLAYTTGTTAYDLHVIRLSRSEEREVKAARSRTLGTQYMKTRSMDEDQTLSINATKRVMHLVEFWTPEVKGQGHQVTCIAISLNAWVRNI